MKITSKPALAFLTSFIVLLLTTSYLEAYLGETRAEIEKRYGKTGVYGLDQRDNSWDYTYIKDGIWIEVNYLNGISRRETYGKGDFTHLSQYRIGKLLRGNCLDSKWELTRSPVDISTKRWRLRNNKALAVQYLNRRRYIATQELEVYTPEYFRNHPPVKNTNNGDLINIPIFTR
jgi:hypothetical protein